MKNRRIRHQTLPWGFHEILLPDAGSCPDPGLTTWSVPVAGALLIASELGAGDPLADLVSMEVLEELDAVAEQAALTEAVVACTSTDGLRAAEAAAHGDAIAITGLTWIGASLRGDAATIRALTPHHRRADERDAQWHALSDAIRWAMGYRGVLDPIRVDRLLAWLEDVVDA